MIRATILTRYSESSATITITIRLIPKIQPLLVTVVAAFVRLLLWKTRPRPLSMNGVNCAAKCAFVDRT